MSYDFEMGTKEVCQGEEKWRLAYLLTKQELSGGIGYGIKVSKDNGECAYTGPLSMKREGVLSLLQRLMECDITPCILNEVVDDWAGSFSL